MRGMPNVHTGVVRCYVVGTCGIRTKQQHRGLEGHNIHLPAAPLYICTVGSRLMPSCLHKSLFSENCHFTREGEIRREEEQETKEQEKS